jgi:hypothetical protein
VRYQIMVLDWRGRWLSAGSQSKLEAAIAGARQYWNEDREDDDQRIEVVRAGRVLWSAEARDDS